MHLAINGMFWSQPTVGSGQYLRMLVHALPAVARNIRLTLLLPAYRAVTEPLPPDIQAVHVQTPFDGRSENLAKVWFEQVAVPLAAARLHADLLHVPYFAPPLVAPLPAVVTILDIIPLILPEYRGSTAVRLYVRLVARAARQTTQIIAISQHSAGDIIHHLGCCAARVTVTPLAAGAQFHPRDRACAEREVAARYGVTPPFVYYVGGLDARKNLATLVHAFARMRYAGGPPATLVIAGRAPGSDPRMFPDLDAMIASAGADSFVRRIDVPYEDAPLLYSAATVFAFPSRYEGFGLPPLEAMACGAPVIVADATSLPEVVGEAALRVPPDDTPGWITALWRVLADDTLRADLSRRGLERATCFRPERLARETLAVYERALNSGGCRIAHNDRTTSV
ncbi:glycosyltransferase family 4 protein [Roseiflexus castenholzii]|uniref:Glycosyl transferase group 1 n=1 Tax=Roseiflexus castenholzii (strain DSM 13941 / HLO8) TaxID=383372 RepID=A7NN84_ROSCS|nr:glycosyltransferase family 1 protein [Roseiflexus castenholzii]ABU59017.1 glycosyl transferase group 1 [Roseiflexus castenholzii DSM 13941]